MKVKNVVLENEMEFKNESKTQRQVTLKASLKISHYNTRTHTTTVFISTKVCSVIEQSEEYLIVVDFKTKIP